MRQSERILTPLEAFRQARLTDRSAPRARKPAGIGGWFDWELVDRKGRAVKGGQFSNLFLNSGLDDIANVPDVSGSGMSTLLAAMAVGTGSSEPLVTDTELDAQLAQTTTATNGTLTRTSPGVYVWSRRFEFGYGAANGNLTEVGVRRVSAGAFWARELFRDGNGDPIVITKTSDYLLRVTYSFQLTLGPVVATPSSIVISGIGTINGQEMFNRGGAERDWVAFFNVAGTSSLNYSAIAHSEVASTDYDTPISTPGSWVDFASASTRSTFTTGVWERSVSTVIPVGQSNGTIRCFGFGKNSLMTFPFIIDPADYFTKDDQHILTIPDLLTVSWGRA